MPNYPIMLLIAALLSAGCASKYAEAPTPTKFEASEQGKLQAARHWELIAKNISGRLIADIQSKVSKSDRIYVETAQKSAFSRSVSLDLIAALTKTGYRVIKPSGSVRPDALSYSVKIDVETEVLEFSKGRTQAAAVGVPSMIASGLWVLDLLETTPAGGLTLAAFGFDAYNWFNQQKINGPVPKTEIIIDLVTSKDGEYLAVTKDIYYVAESDKRLYENLLKNYRLVGEAK
ncbi:hypothetical protein [Pseudomethylobacillus aquaticus]|nr:hypothetical protein [Pseudomethylobacillus aquaticus]